MSGRAGPPRGRAAGLGAAICLALAGCSSYEGMLRALAGPDAEDRREAVLWLDDYMVERAREEGPESVPPRLLVRLRSLAERDPDPMVRADAVAALADAPVEIDPSVFIERLGDPHWEVRRESLRALVRHRDPRAVEPIVARLDRAENFFVRLEALQAVVAYRTEKAYPKLIDILGDVGEENRLRHEAYVALRELTGLSLPFDLYRWRRWYETFSKGEGAEPPEGGGDRGGGAEPAPSPGAR